MLPIEKARKILNKELKLTDTEIEETIRFLDLLSDIIINDLKEKVK